ncbi:NADP-dependent malic enzyme [bacterium]|nr:NADP-dependent malic enzyme [bacterium]
MNIGKKSLLYHETGRKGKIEVIPTKPCATAEDLSLAYSPGVAEPCLEIEKNPENAYKYTAKGNLVAVISNGTAVLGLGNIGALAGKPVMEGKGILFKRFADIDVFDIEVNETNVAKFCDIVASLEPTFGGVNLEDIKAPQCFEIEEELKKRMKIPVFHDDQHGTAIISAAALINALEIAGKNIEDVKVVYSGAGASAMACAKLHMRLGVKKENLLMVDTTGVIYEGRTQGMNRYKTDFAVKTDKRTLQEAIDGADVFIGLSAAGLMSSEMVASMAKNPIIFALANPEPEISYPEAIKVRDDLIMATGRSDYPNQVNNVLGFPFIFRGALDCRASSITENMKLAAAFALAKLAKEEVPDYVVDAYSGAHFEFGREYIIPKPFDSRVLTRVSPAIVEAAIKDGVAAINLDLNEYIHDLELRLSPEKELLQTIYSKAKKSPKKVVFPEGETKKIIIAARRLSDDGFAQPVLLGSPEKINQIAEKHHISLENIEIIDCVNCSLLNKYSEQLYELRQRKGYTRQEAIQKMKLPDYFAVMMLYNGDADGVVTGQTVRYPTAIKPALEIIKTKKGIQKVCGMHVVILKDKIKFFADTTVNTMPEPEDLANIAILTADTVKEQFGITPKIAMLAYSNFGSVSGRSVDRARGAVEIVKRKRPDLTIDGEMQANVALSSNLLKKEYPFSDLKEEANILIFPNLSSGNISYKMMGTIGGAQVVGPILLGIDKPINILEKNSSVDSIVNLAIFTVVQAQKKSK